MSFEGDFNGHLCAASGGVIDLVPAERITPSKRFPGAGKPAITHFVVDDDPQTDLDGGDSGLINFRVQVDIWASTYDQARNIAQAVRLRLQTAASTFNARPLPGSGLDDYEPDTDTHHVVREFSCWYDVPA